jgi:hypothetical protein
VLLSRGPNQYKSWVPPFAQLSEARHAIQENYYRRYRTPTPSDHIREIAARLVDLICMTAEGTFVPDRERERGRERERERDELSATIGTREHGGCCRGKGAVP